MFILRNANSLQQALIMLIRFSTPSLSRLLYVTRCWFVIFRKVLSVSAISLTQFPLSVVQLPCNYYLRAILLLSFFCFQCRGSNAKRSLPPKQKPPHFDLFLPRSLLSGNVEIRLVAGKPPYLYCRFYFSTSLTVVSVRRDFSVYDFFFFYVIMPS